MSRYLVEVPHEPEVFACAGTVRVFLDSGSHYLTHADWGCQDGVHKAWMVVDAESREEARWIVPAPFREAAEVVRLGRFSVGEIDELLATHDPPLAGDRSASPGGDGR
jgi:hypothetical protein